MYILIPILVSYVYDEGIHNQTYCSPNSQSAFLNRTVYISYALGRAKSYHSNEKKAVIFNTLVQCGSVDRLMGQD